MIVRVDVDNVGAMVELDNEPWSPDLVQTLLRICGDEVVRAAIALGASLTPAGEDDDEEPPAD